MLSKCHGFEGSLKIIGGWIPNNEMQILKVKGVLITWKYETICSM